MRVLTSWEYGIYVWLEKQRTLSSVQFSCLVASDSMDCSFPVHHQLPELAQIHVHWVSDAIQSSPLLSPSLPSFPASGSFPMNQFFISGGRIIGASASVLPMNIQDWFPLEWPGLISLQFSGLSRIFSNNTAQKHQFFGFSFLCGLPESSSSSKGISLKGWAVSVRNDATS